ncbi:hypothetical protein VNI00_015774 [Paramarasmius palmivorus]|uniref:Wax synthase domain-containing protein n=1 Tax=Paramarasmius palmivorus TaxID=297713 RepID=A0AAW0BJC1_9AGAR
MTLLRQFLKSGIPYIVLARIILVLVLVPETSLWTRRLSFSVVTYIIAYAITRSTPLEKRFLHIDWTLGHWLVSEWLTASDFLIVTPNVHQELRRIGDVKRWEERALYERIGWVLELTSNYRGTGWTHEPTKLLPKPQPREHREILHRVLILVLLLSANDILVKSNPANQLGSKGIHSYGLGWYIASCISAALCVFLPASLALTAYELGMALLGFKGVWRPLFGSIDDAWCLRRFWGMTWHQIMRRFLSSNASFITHRILRLPRNTKASALVQVSIAFFLSGVIHSTGEYSITRTHPHSPSAFEFWKRGSFWFFMVQPLGIAIESTFFGSLKAHRWLGYTWTLTWLMLTVPMWLNGQVKAGLLDRDIGLVLPFDVYPSHIVHSAFSIGSR